MFQQCIKWWLCWGMFSSKRILVLFFPVYIYTHTHTHHKATPNIAVCGQEDSPLWQAQTVSVQLRCALPLLWVITAITQLKQECVRDGWRRRRALFVFQVDHRSLSAASLAGWWWHPGLSPLPITTHDWLQISASQWWTSYWRLQMLHFYITWNVCVYKKLSVLLADPVMIKEVCTSLFFWCIICQVCYFFVMTWWYTVSSWWNWYTADIHLVTGEIKPVRKKWLVMSGSSLVWLVMSGQVGRASEASGRAESSDVATPMTQGPHKMTSLWTWFI